MFDLANNIKWLELTPNPFYRSEEEFNAFHERLKLFACPYCNMRGFLILNGCIYGYTEDASSNMVKRGHRIFCSNRKKRQGCGRSFSMLKSGFIKHFIISAVTVWIFLSSIKQGLSLIKAFRKTGSSMGETAAYRILKRFRNSQARIRTFLTGAKDPPGLKHVKDPVIRTIIHLKSLFPQSPCPVSEFQHCFQTSFL